MAISSTIIQNLPAKTAQIIFTNTAEFENITYSSDGITYAAEASAVISTGDFSIFFANKLSFYNALISQFPLSPYFQYKIPVSKFEIYSSSGPNILQYLQTSTASPITNVYNITFDRVALTATFAARTNPITNTYQEYLIGFQWMSMFANQIQIG